MEMRASPLAPSPRSTAKSSSDASSILCRPRASDPVQRTLLGAAENAGLKATARLRMVARDCDARLTEVRALDDDLESVFAYLVGRR